MHRVPANPVVNINATDVSFGWLETDIQVGKFWKTQQKPKAPKTWELSQHHQKQGQHLQPPHIEQDLHFIVLSQDYHGTQGLPEGQHPHQFPEGSSGKCYIHRERKREER